MRLPLRRRPRQPEALTSALGTDEQLLATCETVDGQLLAATRFGCWVVDADRAHRIDWHLISKVTLGGGVLRIVLAAEVDTWPESTMVLVDGEPIVYRLGGPTKLTDVVHARVRRSVAGSQHLEWPSGGGWVVLRRVAGRDGLTRQLRLDPGADADTPGLPEAVEMVFRRLTGPRAGDDEDDE